MIKVFVYGTLKPQERYYQSYCADRVVASEVACVWGQLFDLPLGYPALTEGNSRVYGVLLSFGDATILPTLDTLEDYDPARPAHQNEYQRVEIEAFSLINHSLGMVWTYRMDLAKVKRLGGVLLPSGYWTGQL